MKMSVKMKLKNSVGMLLGVTLSAFTLLSQSQAVAANETKENFGKYVGTVKSEWLQDGRKMKLLEDFLYEDPKGLSWKAPSGAIVDGASIPSIAWSVVGTPFYGKYRDASVIHDVACQKKNRNWEDVHLAFYNAMRTSGVSKRKAKIMYAAVYHFGPRWSQIKIVSPQVISKLLTPKLDSQDSSVKKPLSETEIILEFLRNKDIENNIELSVKIPAPKKTLTSKKFDELVVLIKKFEELGSPLSLEQIQAYK
jgi:hypothetical protein